MPKSSLVVVRACRAGHIVLDADVVGILTVEPGVVHVYCRDHTSEFDHALRVFRREQLLLQV